MRTHIHTTTCIDTRTHTHTHIPLCNANSQRDNFIWWKGILERANWISPGSLKNPYHGERSHHVIIRFIEAHSFNLPPFPRAHCIQGPGQWLGDKREPWADNTWKSHKDLAGFVTETEWDFVCVNNASEWRTWVSLPLWGEGWRAANVICVGTHWISARAEERRRGTRGWREEEREQNGVGCVWCVMMVFAEWLEFFNISCSYLKISETTLKCVYCLFQR